MNVVLLFEIGERQDAADDSSVHTEEGSSETCLHNNMIRNLISPKRDGKDVQQQQAQKRANCRLLEDQI